MKQIRRLQTGYIQRNQKLLKEATQSKDSKQKTSEEDNININIETLRISNRITKK